MLQQGMEHVCNRILNFLYNHFECPHCVQKKLLVKDEIVGNKERKNAFACGVDGIKLKTFISPSFSLSFCLTINTHIKTII